MEIQLNSVVMVNHVNGGVKSQLDSCEDKVGTVVRYDGYLPRQIAQRAYVHGEHMLGKRKRHGVSPNCLQCERRDEHAPCHSTRSHEMSWSPCWHNPVFFIEYFTPCFSLLVSAVPFFVTYLVVGSGAPAKFTSSSSSSNSSKF